MRAVILILLVAGLASSSEAVWRTPVNLGSTINSTANDWYPVLARDGSFMIFVSTRAGGFGDSDLWIARRIGGVWQTPQNIGPAVNTTATESAPYLAPGDSTLYFVSAASGGGDIYTCALTDGVPGPKVNLGPAINSSSLDCCPMISRDGSRFYICSDRPGTYGDVDVWVSQRSGNSWTAPVNLDATVNTPETDCPRWLSDDGNTMLICSTRTAGEGGADLWIAENDGAGWCAPVNMGAPVNSAAHELGGWFEGNNGAVGGTLYFGSGRSGGCGGWDIWVATEDVTATPDLGPERGDEQLHLEMYPNPTSSEAKLAYRLFEETRVIINIYDVNGRVIRRLLDQRQVPGDHTARWDTSGDGGTTAPMGVCYYEVRAGALRGRGKIVLQR